MGKLTNIESTIKDLAINGLLIDGAHHKQWFLEQILVSLGFSIDSIRHEFRWTKEIEPGVPP